MKFIPSFISIFILLISSTHFAAAAPSSFKKKLIEKSSPRLTPPWWLLNMKLKATLGKTPGVDVGDLEINPSSSCWRWFSKSDEAIIPITTSDQEVANSLALVLESSYTTGGMKIKLEISGPQGPGIAPEPSHSGEMDLIGFVQEHLKIALNGNPYFVTIHRLPSHLPLTPDLSVEFSTTEIQIHDDNLFDYYGYDTFVAQALFTEALKNQFFDSLVTSATTTSPVSKPFSAPTLKVLPSESLGASLEGHGIYPSLHF